MADRTIQSQLGGDALRQWLLDHGNFILVRENLFGDEQWKGFAPDQIDGIGTDLVFPEALVWP